MKRLAILDDYVHAALDSADWGRLASKVELTVFDRPFSDRAAAIADLQPFDILCVMRERTPLPRALIEQLPHLKLIVTSGGVNRSIDVAAAKESGVLVCHTTGKDGSASTIELTWALILACARDLPRQELSLRAHGWQDRLGVRLAGKTLGLLGLGKIGARVAAVGSAFGMQPIAWSQNLTASRAQAAGARRVEKEELLREADVVSIHLVLSERTRGLIGARELNLLKPSAILVNTSRGPIIDQTALLDALDRGVPACVGLDVYDIEPLPDDHPLRRAENVVLSPHLGYATADNFRDFYSDMIEDIEAWLSGAPIRVTEA
jgi:phosphoglycerate dehydrogenase-like enzyme